MATPDLTIAPASSLPEQALTAGTPVCVLVQPAAAGISTELQVVNNGAGMLYIRPGATCAVKDPAAQLLPPGGFGTVTAPAGWGNLLTFVSATDGSFSLIRR